MSNLINRHKKIKSSYKKTINTLSENILSIIAELLWKERNIFYESNFLTAITFSYSKIYNIYPKTWKKNDQEDISLDELKSQFPVTIGVINVEENTEEYNQVIWFWLVLGCSIFLQINESS